jgi:preprotein translocase subunit SecD
VPGSTPDGSTPASTPAVGSTPVTPAGFGSSRALAAPPTTDPGSTVGSTPPTTVVPGSTVPGDTTVPTSVPATTDSATTVLRQIDGSQCVVGPAGGAGDEIFKRDSAGVQLSQQEGWTVNVGLSGSGSANWNTLATECYNGTDACPSHQLAIVLDDVIQSAPVVRQPSFTDTVSITGNFTEGEARSLSRVLNRGAFPTDVEVLRVDTVSPTLGKDSMRASIFAGLVGVALLLLLLIVFYRRLTLLIALGMAVWAMLIYSVSVLISQTTNYALTLAGVTGIIVSIGMTVDSYVVYFERMKDEVVHGRTFKNSAARSFKSTWRTILAANLVSFIAAAVLFVLSVGSVRGFALYLGVTTICDVIVLWFFTRPAVILMAGTGRLDKHDQFGLGAPPA